LISRTNQQQKKVMKNKINSLCVAICLTLPLAATVSLTGCAGDTYKRSTGEYIDDKSLNARVNSALGENPEYKFKEVKVTSYRGTVQLSGFVNTSDQKRRAEDIAEKVQGVHRVENNITVKDKIS